MISAHVTCAPIAKPPDMVMVGFASTSLPGPTDDKERYKAKAKPQTMRKDGSARVVSKDETAALPTSATADGAWRPVLVDFGIHFAEGKAHRLLEDWSRKYAEGMGVPGNFWYPLTSSGMVGMFPAVCVCDLEDATRLLSAHVQKPRSYSALMIGDGVLSQVSALAGGRPGLLLPHPTLPCATTLAMFARSRRRTWGSGRASASSSSLPSPPKRC
jgi:hypothetical protein